jgi:hypothetical protein
MHFPGWIVGPAIRGAEKLHDILDGWVGIRFKTHLGFVAQGPRVSGTHVIVTVYNRSDREEAIESVYLVLSQKAGSLLMVPGRPWGQWPQTVTRTKPYTIGYELSDVVNRVTEARAERRNDKITVEAVGVNLASGRSVERKVKVNLGI